MKSARITQIIKLLTGDLALIRHRIILGVLAPFIAFSLSACNGNVFSSLPGNSNQMLYMMMLGLINNVSDVQVSSITSDNSNGTYGISSSYSVVVTFSGPVTLDSGIIDVTLNSGEIAHVTTAHPTIANSYYGIVTVAEGDSTPASVYLNATAITRIGGTLYDSENRNVLLTIPASSNIANNKNMIIDGIRPVITSITTSTSNGTYGSGAGIDITVNYSETVSLSGGTLDLALNSFDGSVYATPQITGIGGSTSSTITYTVGTGYSTFLADLTITGITPTGLSVIDNAGNTMADFTIPGSSNLADNSDIIINGTMAGITSITSAKADGRYGIGTSIGVTVNFSSSVKLTGGTLDVTLNSGETISINPFTGTSGSATYTVTGGHNSTDLAVTGIVLNGGTIETEVGLNPVDLDVTGNNLSTNSIIIDTTSPTISSVTSSSANGTYGNGTNVNVTVNFNEPVTLSGGPLNVTLDTGHVISLSAVTYPSSVLTGTYTVAVGETSPDLTAVSPLSLTGTIIDACDENPNTLTGPTTLSIPALQNLADNKAIVIDGVLPTVSLITSTNTNSSYGIGSTINIQVQFSKNVTLAGGTLDVTLGTGDVISFNTINNTNIANATYTVGSGDNSADLTATSIALSSGATLRDAANNNTAVSLPSGQNIGDLKNIIIDTTKPTIASVTSTTLTGTYGTGAIVNITVTFSEPVTLTGGGLNVTLNSTRGATPITVVIAPFGIASSTATTTYTVVANDTSSGADLNADSIALGTGATITDTVATNPNTMTVFTVPALNNLADDADSKIKIDGVLPLISSINSSTPDGTYGSSSPIIVELNFSKPVTLAGGVLNVTLDTGDVITVSAGAYPATTLTGTYTVGSGDASADLNVTNIALGGVATLRDSVANSPNNAVLMPLPSSNLANNRAFVIDGVLPVITSINSSTSNGTYGAGAVINVTINFNKAVTLAGAGTLDLTLDTGEVVSIAAISGATTATGTYTVGAGETSADLNVTGIALSGAATLRDSVPNNPNNANLALPSSNLANNKAIVIDGVAPVITSITSTTADGRYGPGAVINVRLNFSKNVTLTGGSLGVTLDTGDVLSIPTISNATQANVNYTVGAGDTSTDLNVTGIALNSATLNDQVANNPNNADLSLPAGQNMSNNKALVIDSTPPTITSVTSTSGDGTYGTGGTINVTVNFSEPIQIVGASGILITLNSTNGGTPKTVTLFNADVSGSSASKTYTVAANDTTSGVDLLVSSIAGISGATIRDVCTSNSNTLTDYSIPGGQNLADSTSIVVNGIGASISSITSSTADGRYGGGSTINVTVNFSASATLTGGTLDVTLDNGAVVSINPFVGTSASATYTVAGGQNSSDLSATNIVLNGGTIVTTIGGNVVNLSLPVNNFSTKNIIVDTTAPTIASVTSTTSNGTYGAGATVNVRILFSEPVTLTGASGLNVTLDTGSVVNITPFTNASTANGTYTVAAGQSSTDLTVSSVALGSGATLKDTSTSQYALTDFSVPGGSNLADNKAIVIDGVAPVISSINSSTSDGAYGVGASINVQVNFSEPVTLAGGLLNVTLSTGDVVSVSAGSYPASQLTGTYTVGTGDSSADLNVTLAALGGSATLRDDVANNPNNANLALPVSNLANNKAIVIDGVVPTISSISSSTGNDTYGAGAIINITVTFSKNVTLAGGTLDLTLDTGTVVQIPAFTNSLTASGSYTVTSGQSSADLDVDSLALGGGATLRDTVPNNPNNVDISLPSSNLAYNKAIVIDGVVPVISSISSSTINGTYGIGANVDVTVTFSKNVTLAGGTLDLTLDTGAVVQIAAFTNSLTASGTYNVTSGQSSSDLNVSSIVLNGATLLDTVPNNPNSANLALPASNLANNKAIVIDGLAPTISSVTSMTANGTYPSGENINVTVYFSESVTLSSGTLDVALNSGYTLHISPFSGTSANGTYTVLAGNTTSGGYLTATGIGTTGGTISDGASNALSDYSIPATQNIGDLKNIIVDGVLPAISAAETMDVDHDGRIDYYKITFNKNIKDSTFPGYSSNNLGTAQTDWLVAGHTSIVLAHGTAAPVTDTINDTIIYLMFNEIPTGYDTDSKPDLTTTLTPGLTDTIGTTGNPLAQVGTTTIIETDKAAPIIVASSGVTGTNVMAITFSEPVDPNGSTGACSSTIGSSAFTYVNSSGGGVASISSMSGDTTACDDNKVTVQINTNLTAADLSPIPDQLHAAASALYDMGDNPVDSSLNVAISGAISPYVLGVTATGTRKIRITYSEPVDNSTGATGAMNLANYTLIEDPVQSGCSGGSDTINLTGSVTEVTANTDFELTVDADECPTTTYRLTVANVVDINDSVVIVAPVYGNFLGNERLKVSSASCLTTSTMVVVFNKAVLAGSGNNGAESTARYLYTGPTNLGTISSAVRGTGGNTNQVTLTHSVIQTGSTYTVIGANTQTSDGFDETSISGTPSYRPIKTADLAESLQDSPRDRSPWVGCGTAITDLEQGPVSNDPFGDGTTFGYLASYAGKVYIGPNVNGNAANRMEPDATNPVNVYFSFAQDTGTVDTSSNSATTRDGGIAVPPYVTIGHTGCTTNSGNLATGCGPDNEDGRGVFNSGTLGASDYIIMGGARTTANFNYLYYSSSTGITLSFNYIDLGTITGTATQGLSSFNITGDRIFIGMAKTQATGHANNSPDFGKVNFTTSTEGNCLAGSNCDATDGVNGARFFINHMPYFGGGGQYDTNSSPNWAWMVGVDSLYIFNGYIYAANGGHNATNHNGAVIRSSVDNGGTSNNPRVCSAVNVCDDWSMITPSDAAWYNTDQRYSVELTKIADLIPADKAVPGFADFNGNLYMIRNSCNVASSGTDFDTAAHTTAGCTDGSYTNRQPQLWKCVPGANNTCESGEWSLVAETGGVTNMGTAANHSITMVIRNGSRLYIGFDSVSGVQVWRTKSGVTNPTAATDFEQVGTTGLNDPTNMLQIFSTLSINQGSDYNLYICTGKNLTPMSVYRQVNQ